jgi:hypothetical protein
MSIKQPIFSKIKVFVCMVLAYDVVAMCVIGVSRAISGPGIKRLDAKTTHEHFHFITKFQIGMEPSAKCVIKGFLCE